MLTDSHFHDWNNPSFPAINAGCSADDLFQRIQFYSKYPDIVFAAAMGPWEVQNRTKEEILSQFEILKENIRKFNPLFIGETGLDYHWNYGNPDIQKELFSMHLELAEKSGKKVLIHSRDASIDSSEIIKDHSCTGVIHCCDGSMNLIETALSKGYMISFAGNITYNANENLRQALKTVPKDRLLLETDAPYLAPKPFRGKTNSPDLIIYTYEAVAEILDVPLQNLIDTVYENYQRFIN